MKRTVLMMALLLFCGRVGLAAPVASGMAAPAGEAAGKQQGQDENNGQGAGWDEEDGVAEQADGQVVLAEPVTIRDKRLPADPNTVSGQALEMMPSVTGSITEALKGRSNVQFGYDQDSSQTLGEIAPPRISISGAKPYENNFSIDGMSVTNTLNPSGFDNSAGFNDLMVGGGDQTIFYDTNLLESITLFPNNIPAEYGGFVGGVVDAKLRDPLRDRWHFTVQGRYTEDAWFNMRDVDRDSDSADSQPEFSIYNGFFSAEGPLTDYAGLLLSVSRRQSFIPLLREEPDGTQHKDDQKRRNDNYFARLVLNPTPKLKLTLDATYAPYEEKRWRAAWPDSDWKNENKSWRFVSQAEYAAAPGLVTAKIAYAQNGFSRDNANNYRYSLMDLGDRSQDDNAGGVGDAQNKTKQLNIMANFKSRQFDRGDFRWKFASGLDFGYKHTDSWNEAATSDVMILYAAGSRRSLHTLAEYDEMTQSAHIANYGFFAQTDLTWKRLTLSPGVRVDYEDFSNNVDVAPRLKAEVDTFGNGVLRVIAGANRYYGSQLRAYALDRFRPFRTTQTTVFTNGNETTVTRTGTDKSFSSAGVDTPYSDELMGGLAGNILGFDYGVDFVHRDKKDQVIAEKGDGDNYYLTNKGESTFNGVTVSLARTLHTRRWGNHTFSLSANKSKTKTFNGSYYSEIVRDSESNGYRYSYDHVYLNGEYIARFNMPADDFNAPLIIALTTTSSLFEDRLRINAVTRWRDSAEGLLTDARRSDDTPYGTTTGRNDRTTSEWLTADGRYVDAFKEGTINGGVVTDLTIEYDAFRKDRYALTLIAEVVNLFNSTMETSVSEGGATSRGRGFYAGLRATF